jgi:tetratricopeptide (TPR) repeat protein
MRRTLTAALAPVVLSLAFASGARAQATAATAQTPPATAQSELMQGARSYREGKFAEAEQHFRRSLELDPARANTRVFIARSIQQQFKPRDASPENTAVAERAVAAYQEILDAGRANEAPYEDAYKALIFINGQLKRDDKVVEMLTLRANDSYVSNENRADAFVLLASRKWQCSYDITERPENSSAEKTQSAPSSKYKMPSDEGDFVKARGCVDEGLQLVGQAVSLAPDSPNALAYKANLLREASKLAEMEGDEEQKADYDRQSDEALDGQKRTGARETLPKSKSRERSDPEPPQSTAPPALTHNFAPRSGYLTPNFG